MRLLCSAWQEELRYLCAKQELVIGEPQQLAATDILVATLGIGYLEAALNLSKILDANPEIDEIVFLGTCGVYGTQARSSPEEGIFSGSSDLIAIGDLVNVRSVALLERGLIANNAYSVIKERIVYKAHGELISGLQALPCLSSLEITNSEEFSRDVLKYYGYVNAVENMELYGVARVCAARGLPWRALLGVTNYTNANAHQDWLREHQRVSELMTKSFVRNCSQ